MKTTIVATYKRLIQSFLLVTPRVLNIVLTLLIAPLFFKLWGDDYSFYVTVTMAGSFASIVGQPVINRYYEYGSKYVSIGEALYAYFVAYFILIVPALGIYLWILDDSGAQMLSTVLFPLVIGALLVVRASYFKFSRQRQSALIETIFLIIKIPCGYALAYSSVIANVTTYTFYFALCCMIEVWVLVAYATDKSSIFSDSGQRIKNFYGSRFKRFAIGSAICFAEVLSGNIDRVMLSVFERSHDLVLYSFSLTAAAILYVLPSQINAQSQHKYFKLESKEHAWRLILRNWSDLAVVTIIPVVVFLYVGEWLTGLWLGRALTPDTILVVYHCSCVLMCGVVINCFCSPLINYLHALGHAHRVWIATTLSLIVFCIGLTVVIPNATITYVAIVASLSIFFKFLLIGWSTLFPQKIYGRI
jgi:O-antigen/teichoic acid export membrane protein